MNNKVFTRMMAFVLCVIMCFMMPLNTIAQTTDDATQEGTIPPAGEDVFEDEKEEEEEDIYANAINVSSGDDLAEALEQGAEAIRITADFQLDRTFYITISTTIFSEEAHTLTRDPAFGGDIFVVGEYSDGTLCETEVKLTLGDPESVEKNLLVINGNRANMTADVTGTVIFVVCGASADIYENITIKNNKKVGNEKTLTEKYGVSYVGRIGGPVAILSADTTMNIYGGTFSNNAVNDITDGDTEEGQVSSQGGVIYNFGTLNVYNGTFEGNYAGRGGVFYCYRTTNIYSAIIQNNTASNLGGAVYMPNSTAAFLNIGTPNDLVKSNVIFEGNISGSHGGAIYARNKMTVKNTTFTKNTAVSGGAIIAYNMQIIITDSTFNENTASNHGGAIYLSGHNDKDVANDLTLTGCSFTSNTSANNGGAIYLTTSAVALVQDTDFTTNSATSGGAIYCTKSQLTMEHGTFTKNTADSNGGAVALYTSSTAVLNKITSTNNSANIGGSLMVKASALTIYRSKIEKNTSTSNGGGIALYDDASASIYATDFSDNTAQSSGNGGAIFLYTNTAEVLIHSCSFNGNKSNYGGAMYASNKSIAKIYNITATNNSSNKGGFLYETTTGTVLTLVGATISGNTATDGGPIIWGNSTGAVLNIDKSKFNDSDHIGDLDKAYWSSAIVNKLTVKDISEEIPQWLDYKEESYEHMANAVDVSTAQQLEDAIASGAPFIRVIADIQIDRTFYITGNTTIFSTLPRKLTRAPGFGGDIFVIGENAEGKSALLLGNNAKLVLGNPLSKQENLLIIDGNKENMTVPVKGSVLFIGYSSTVDLHTNVTVENIYKSDNERTYNEVYKLSRPNRVGGTLAIVASGSLNIYGGIYRNNMVNEEDVSSEETRNSTIGGLIYNNSNVYIHGGTFENNQAARGGVIYNYRIFKIYGGNFIGNIATVSGGVAYAPNLSSSHTHIGSTDANGTKVLFQNNTSNSHGGAIYSSPLCSLVIHGNTIFDGNIANSNGGAICSYGQLTARDTVFSGNTAKNQGGAVYAANSSDTYVTRINNFEGCTFENNQATLGGALSVYSSNKEYPNGGIATVTDCRFIGNQAASLTSKSANSYGGAIYVERKSSITLKETVFEQNSARTEGGAIYAAGASNVSISDTDFNENAIFDNGKHGGAISIHSVILDITSVNFTNNTAVVNGGALYVSYSSSYDQNSQVTLKESSFTGNSTEKLGGAMYVTKQTVTEEKRILTADNISFKKNSASEGGAIYFVNGTTAYMTDMTFTENAAIDGIGGGIASSGGNLEIDNASFTGNTSTGSGAGIYLSNQAQLVLNAVTATNNASQASGGFLYMENSTITMYNSIIKKNTAVINAGAMALYSGAAANIYATDFVENTAEQNGGGVFLYTNTTPCVLHTCTFTGNSGVYGGAIYASNKSVASLYNITARNNTSSKGGFLYETTTDTELTLAGITVGSNTASSGGPIIWGNSNGAVLHLDKVQFTDEDHSGKLNAEYWAKAIVNKLTVEETSVTVTDYDAYESKRDLGTTTPVTKDPVSVNDVFSLAQKSSDGYINNVYDALPKLDNSSNFMSKNVTTFENINGGTVTVDSFIYPTYGTADNCNVGQGLLIYQAMCYKKAHPEEEVYIDISSYRFSVQAAVNINRNSRYFGYMRNLTGTANYDQYGFVRIAYLLVSAAKMGIHITAIGHIDAYPVNTSSLKLYDYFTTQLNDPCDPDYVQGGVIGDYLNFCQIDWTLPNKGGTDMMHTKLCAVSHYLDKDGVAHKNAVWTSSSNLDGINSSATNGNWKQQTATIVTGHEAIYQASVNYLRLIAKYKGQEEIYEFQNLVNRRSTEQAQMILAGRENEIPADEQIIYLGRDTDPVFELYFTPMGGDILAWDEVQNPYCKYLRKLYNSEDYIIFTWNAAEYNGDYALGHQIESMIIAAFHDNRNINNKIYCNMEHFDATTFDDLVVGVDLGVKSFNELEFGEVHNKDVQFSYVENGQRYYVSLLNSMNMHSGSMYFQSNFALVIKETYCNEDSVFFTIADQTTNGIVEHAYDYSEEKEYIPETNEDGYKYYSCSNCDKILITETIHRESNWIIDKKASPDQNGIRHKNCTACGILLQTQEYSVSQEESTVHFADTTERTFSKEIKDEQRIQLSSTPQTFEATVYVPKDFNDRAGVILGNYDETSINRLNLEIYNMGKVRLFITNNGQSYDCLFNTDIRSDKPVHIALTVDGTVATLYVDGELAETKELPFGLPELTNNYIIGGDARKNNPQYFKGSIYSVNLFSDVRTSEEIKKDKIAVHTNEDALLISKYFTTDADTSVSSIPSGKTFTESSQHNLGSLSQAPLTIEAVIQLLQSQTARAGVIVGNYDETSLNQLNLEVYTDGKLRLFYTNNGQRCDCIFNVDIRSSKPVHVAVVIDGLVATAYVNGVAKESITLSCQIPSVLDNMKIGSDNRSENTQYFKGKIYSVNLFSDSRTTEEIKNDVVLVRGNEDNILYSTNFAIDNSDLENIGSNPAKFNSTTIHNLGTLSTTPQTIEATIHVPKSLERRGGIILGNYDETSLNKLNFEIYTSGKVRLFLTNNGEKYDCLFDTDIRSDKPVHIALTVDGTVATLYVDGELAETKELPFGLPELTNEYRIGGDARIGNTEYFRGSIYSVNLFSDVRTPEEILRDMSYVSNSAENLLSSTRFITSNILKEAEDFVITGKTFTSTTSIPIDNSFEVAPQTFEAIIHVPKDSNDRVGVILGNYNYYDPDQMTIEVYTMGRIRLFLTNNGERFDCIFNTDIRSDGPVHIAVTVDGTIATLYINGELAETKELPFGLPKLTDGYIIGGDARYGNEQYFKGTIYAVNLFRDVKTSEEIKNNMVLTDSYDASLLYSTIFAKSLCEFYGHKESSIISDFEATTESNGLSHTECLVCDKVLICSKTPATEIVVTRDFENAKGMITDTQSGGYVISEPLSSVPRTFEALIQLSKTYEQRAGVIMGNYDGGTGDQINLEIYTNGKPRLFYKTNGVTYTYLFKTDIRSDSLTHIALTFDGLLAHLYVDGVLKETITLTAELPDDILNGFVVGSDNRDGNTQHFKGTIYSASIFGDVRTLEEIAVDRFMVASDSDELLFSKSFLITE